MTEVIQEKRIKRTHAILELVKTILPQYDQALTLRQLFYRLVGRDITFQKLNKETKEREWITERYVNTDSNYKGLSRLLVLAREQDEIDVDAIEDRLRTADIRGRYNPANIGVWDRNLWNAEYYMLNHSLDHWIGQPNVAVGVLEKDALSGVIGTKTDEHEVSLVVNRGYNSYTQIHQMCKNLSARVKNNRTIHFLIFGDYDPTGHDIIRNFQKRTREIMAKLYPESEVKMVFNHIGLHREQIDELQLPPVPAKKSDRRTAAFVAEHGDEIVELDSVDPPILQEWIENAILEIFDDDIYQKVKAKEETQKEYLENKWKKLRELWNQWLADNPDDDVLKDDDKNYNHLIFGGDPR